MGLGAAPLAPLLDDTRDPGDSSGQIPSGHLFCTGIALERHSLEIIRPILLKTYYIIQGRRRRPAWQPEAPQSCPRAAQGTQKEPKVAQIGNKAVERHAEEKVKSHPCPYTYTPYSQTHDPPPYRGVADRTLKACLILGALHTSFGV